MYYIHSQNLHKSVDHIQILSYMSVCGVLVKVLDMGGVSMTGGEGCSPPAESGLMVKTGINTSNQYNPNRKTIRLNPVFSIYCLE